MSFGPNGKEHYNLYYIYAEEKKKRRISLETAMLLWKRIFKEIIDKPPDEK